VASDELVGRVKEVLPEVAVEGLTPAEYWNHQIGLANWLQVERPARVADTPVTVQLTADEIQGIEEPEQTNAAPLQVGLVVPLTAPVSLDGLSSSKTGNTRRDGQIAGGAFTRTRDGGFVWSLAVRSEGAGGIRVHIEGLSLPRNAELYFYSDAGEAYGPYTGFGPDNNGDLWTPSIIGPQGTVQVRVYADNGKADLDGVSLRITEVGHISRSFFGIAEEEGGVASFCTYNAPCIENTNCVNESAVNDLENAVAKMLWVQGCCIYTCSGGLIADSDAGTQIPYFMTAGHCITSSNSGLEAFFKYQVSCGTSNCTATFTDPPSSLIAGKTVGATIKASGSISNGDYSLLQLNQNPPAGSFFLGWTTTPVSGTNGAVLHRVSHPEGSPQAYSQAEVDTGAGTCQGWPRGPLIYSRGTIGGTQGGSSGAPVINASGQFVGQLTGGCGTNINDDCDHQSNATVDGAFAHYYPNVASFLAGGGGCQPAGTTCSSNSQCCSNRCRGNRCR